MSSVDAAARPPAPAPGSAGGPAPAPAADPAPDPAPAPEPAPPAVTARAEVVPLEASGLELVRRGTRLAVGGASLGLGALAGALARAGGAPALQPPEPGLLPSAAFGMVVEAQRLAFDAAAVTRQVARTLGRGIAAVPPVRQRVTRARDALAPWRERGLAEQARLRAEAVALFDALLPRIVDGVIARVDMGQIVDRIDIDAIVDRLDIDRIVDRLDIDQIVDRLDLGGIIADSTTGIAGETIDAVRVQAMRIDGVAAGIVDAILRRRGPRTLPQPADDSRSGARA